MKVYTLFCPNCGASLNIESDKNSFFCTHCGSQILVDDETQRIEITKNINKNVNYTRTDNTKIEKARSEERVHIKKEETKQKKEKYDAITTIAGFSVVILLWLFIFLYAYLG